MGSSNYDTVLFTIFIACIIAFIGICYFELYQFLAKGRNLSNGSLVAIPILLLAIGILYAILSR